MPVMSCILCETAKPELIDAKELARRWVVPVSWIREHTRPRCADPIPHIRMGKYVRFEWGSEQLAEWHAKCRNFRPARVRERRFPQAEVTAAQ